MMKGDSDLVSVGNASQPLVEIAWPLQVKVGLDNLHLSGHNAQDWAGSITGR